MSQSELNQSAGLSVCCHLCISWMEMDDKFPFDWTSRHDRDWCAVMSDEHAEAGRAAGPWLECVCSRCVCVLLFTCYFLSLLILPVSVLSANRSPHIWWIVFGLNMQDEQSWAVTLAWLFSLFISLSAFPSSFIYEVALTVFLFIPV